MILNSFQRAVPEFLGSLRGDEYVHEDKVTGARTSVWRFHKQYVCDTERFIRDYLGKWYLADLLNRVGRAIDGSEDLIPKLPVSDEAAVFLRAQQRILLYLP